MDKLWCIINLKELSNGHWFAGGSRYGYRLDGKHAPTAFYENKKYAEDELLRLSDKDGEFAMFELCGYVVESPVTVMAKHIEAPTEDDWVIPF